MSKLFITSREIAFINDITKEVIKDIIGQYIFYYPISTLKTQIHPIYDEAVDKIFENPIKLEVLAGQPSWEVKTNQFGFEQQQKLELNVQIRDLLDKGFTLSEGDYFIYGDLPFEIMSVLQVNNIYGQADHELGYKISGRLARKSEFDPNFYKKQIHENNKNFADAETQKVFEQQRGLDTNNVDGLTGDVRQIRERLSEDMAPIALGEGPRKVGLDEPQRSTKFYEDD